MGHLDGPKMTRLKWEGLVKAWWALTKELSNPFIKLSSNVDRIRLGKLPYIEQPVRNLLMTKALDGGEGGVAYTLLS